MILEISFSIYIFLLLFFHFHFFKQSFLGIIDFWLKTPQITRVDKKKGQNHQFALLSFTFQKKISTFWRWPFFYGPLTWNRPTAKSYKGYYWTPKMVLNWHLAFCYARCTKKPSAESRSPLEELEVGPSSRLYLLVLFRAISLKQLMVLNCIYGQESPEWISLFLFGKINRSINSGRRWAVDS